MAEDRPAGGPAGKYLVDDTGNAAWLVDPGINGEYTTRPDGTQVRKFSAPKATLMSYIVKGILDRKLPWALVLFGVMIAIVLELCGIPSLAFAVGVYLPISSSAPVFVGGLVRWLVDKRLRHQLREHKLTKRHLTAESDKSPGVLLASGYIAGGAIAGILIAFMEGGFGDFDSRINSGPGPQPVLRWPECGLAGAAAVCRAGRVLVCDWPTMIAGAEAGARAVTIPGDAGPSKVQARRWVLRCSERPQAVFIAVTLYSLRDFAVRREQNVPLMIVDNICAGSGIRPLFAI